ncbi:MAG: transglycosylase SLT domain-containing protein [Gammaproteobacteria bacterium]|nr:transglycosylase SLT domain-containing protein [Gammaproteobacteria bacterium]MCP5458658.1 transglycosylase SLT domain-containing protein [Gammaproteobacteria bacterium]
MKRQADAGRAGILLECGLPSQRPLSRGRWHFNRIIGLWFGVLCATWCVQADELTLSTQRLAFVAADKALQAGVPVAITPLRDYPLYPYLVFRSLQQHLQDLPTVEIRAFLRDYADTPLARRLRGAWLRQLATAQRWDDYLLDYQPDDSVELGCWQRQALLATGKPQLALEGIAEVWMQGVSLPNACDPVFEFWRQQGGFTPERVWRRFTLALDKGQRGLAVYLKGLLPAAQQPMAEHWLQVDANPALLLDLELDPREDDTAAIVLYGLNRWSQQDSVAAAAALDVLLPRYPLPPHALVELQRQLALFVASRGHPSGLPRLNALPAEVVDEQVREWRVRVHLAKPDWQAVLAGLDGLLPDDRAKPLWLYWRARALEASGLAEQSRAIYEQLAGLRDYHGFLAADRIGKPYQIVDVPLVVDNVELNVLERLPGLQRAHELFLLQRFWEAGVEWREAIAGLTPAQLQQAAKLAQRWGWDFQAILTLARTDYWDDLTLRFPTPHQQRVIEIARETGMDPAWLFAIQRQESLFRSDARSPAGALGLMQILPTTAEHIAVDAGFQTTTDLDLVQADTNIRLGAYYLRQILGRLQNNVALATAAYNAGPERVIQWLPIDQASEADRWVETIPYWETRNYVKHVMEYAIIYGRRLNDPPVRLLAHLGEVLPAPVRPFQPSGLLQ